MQTDFLWVSSSESTLRPPIHGGDGLVGVTSYNGNSTALMKSLCPGPSD